MISIEKSQLVKDLLPTYFLQAKVEMGGRKKNISATLLSIPMRAMYF